MATFGVKTTCQVKYNYIVMYCGWFKILIYICDWYTNGDVSYVHGMNVIPLDTPNASWKYSTIMTGCKLWSESKTCDSFEGLKCIDNNIWEKHSTFGKILFLCNIKQHDGCVKIFSLAFSLKVITDSTLLLGKGKAFPVLAWTGPEGSSWLRLRDFKTVGTWKW